MVPPLLPGLIDASVCRYSLPCKWRFPLRMPRLMENESSSPAGARPRTPLLLPSPPSGSTASNWQPPDQIRPSRARRRCPRRSEALWHAAPAAPGNHRHALLLVATDHVRCREQEPIRRDGHGATDAVRCAHDDRGGQHLLRILGHHRAAHRRKREWSREVAVSIDIARRRNGLFELRSRQERINRAANQGACGFSLPNRREFRLFVRRLDTIGDRSGIEVDEGPFDDDAAGLVARVAANRSESPLRQGARVGSEPSAAAASSVAEFTHPNSRSPAVARRAGGRAQARCDANRANETAPNRCRARAHRPRTSELEGAFAREAAGLDRRWSRMSEPRAAGSRGAIAAKAFREPRPTRLTPKRPLEVIEAPGPASPKSEGT